MRDSRSEQLRRNLDSLRVSRPCPKKWEDMRGGDRKRFCEHCQLHVHNLSAMSPHQIGRLAETSGRRCVVYLADTNGDMVRLRRFDSVRKSFSRASRLAAALLASLFPFVFAACSNQHPSPTLGEPLKQSESLQPAISGAMVPGQVGPQQEEPQVLMGDVCPPDKKSSRNPPPKS